MSPFTIFSPFKPITISSEDEDLALPELLVKRNWENANKGKTDRIMDVITEESYDFASFDILTHRIASYFYKRGLRNGDVVIYMTNDLVKLQLFMCGIWRANGIVRACYPEEDFATIKARVEESRVGWIYCDPAAAEMCLNVADVIYWDVEIISTSQTEGCLSIYDAMEDDGTEMPEYKRSSQDPAAIMSTSGTTGASKGASLSNKAIILLIHASLTTVPFYENDPNYLISKGTHITGILFPLVAMMTGASVLVMHSITKDYMFKAIHTHRPKLVFGFPSLLTMLVNDESASDYDFSCIELIVAGGAAVTFAIEKILMQLPNIKHVLNVYGLTEVGPVVGFTNADAQSVDDACIPGIPDNAIGKLCGGVSAQFRDIFSNQPLGPNETGELCVKCDWLFTEYVNNPKATDSAFEDGFFKTGDVGYYDENEFIFLVDRAKDIFKYLGNHVSPTEIENVINDHPDVGEVCVVGIPDPNGGGHIPRAFCVVLRGSTCTPEEILKFTNEQLPTYKHLRGGVYFLEKLPTGKTGKVSRQILETMDVIDLI